MQKFVFVFAFCLALSLACTPSLTSDPYSGGASVPAGELSAAGPPATACIESRVVNHFYQPEAPVSAPARTNCPHLRAGLTSIDLKGRGAGANVDVVGNRILRDCDVDSTLLGRITVKSGSELVFDDANINLHVREILVEAGATLTAGSTTCPLYGKLDIMVHGTRGDSSLQNDDRTRTSKGLVVEGVAELHAKKYAPTWTRLAKTAAAGDRIIFVQHALNWEVGQKIVVLTSAWDDCPANFQAAWCNNRAHQNEEMTIEAITMDRQQGVYAVKLTAPLSFLHYAGEEYQTEVALMDRRMKIWGAASGDGFGVHVLVLGSGQARISGLQVENGGQAHVMARYPLHFHVLREAPNSYIEDTLITNSNFRSIVIHGTNSSRFSRNVGYNIQGMALYLEDGVEEKNLIEYNLMAHVHPVKVPADGDWGQGGQTFTSTTDLIVPVDTSASGFYISNAYNDFIGNAASGGWSGFAFPNVPRPLGIFKDQDWKNGNPQHRPTRTFKGNTAHSSGFYWKAHGSCFYTGAWIDYTTVNNVEVMRYHSGRRNRQTRSFPDGGQAFMTFEDIKAWACGPKAVAHWGNEIELHRYESHDNRNSAMFFGSTAMIHAWVKARTANPTPWQQYGNAYALGFQWYDTWVKVILSDVVFEGFKTARGDAAIQYLTHSDEWLPQGINAVRGIKFVDTDVAARMGTTRCGVECGEAADVEPSMAAKIAAIMDWDGSVAYGALAGAPALLGSKQKWWGPWNDCVKNELGFWGCPWTANRDLAYITPHIPVSQYNSCSGNCQGQRAYYTVGRMQHWGRPVSEGINMSPWPGVTGLANTGWLWRVKNTQTQNEGAPSRFEIGSNTLIPRNAFVVLAIRYPAAAVFTIIQHDRWSNPKDTPMPQRSWSEITQPREDTLNQGLGWYRNNDYLFIRIVDPIYQSGNGGHYEADGVRLWNVHNRYIIRVSVTCPGCTVQSSHAGVTFWEVSDSVPGSFPHAAGAARAAAPPSVWNRPNTCGTAPPPPPPTTPTTTTTTTTITTTTSGANPPPPTTTSTTTGANPPPPTTTTSTTTTVAPTTTTTTSAGGTPPTTTAAPPPPGTNFRVDPLDYPTENVLTLMGGKAIVRWATLPENKIRIAVEAEVNGWIGFGLSVPGQKMVGADIVSGSTENGAFTVRDMHSPETGPPVLDSESHLEQAIGGITDGQWTSMEFTMPIFAANAVEDRSFLVGETTEFILAFGANPTMSYHGDNRVVSTAVFVGSDYTPGQGATDTPPNPAPPGLGPVVPCVLAQPSANNDYRPFLMHVDLVWEQFDCTDFLQKLATFLGIRLDRIRVVLAKKGSAILTLQVMHAPADTDGDSSLAQTRILDDVAKGSPELRNAGLPVTTATSGNQSATNPSGGIPIWLIALIAIIAVVLVVATIVVIILCVRKHRRNKSVASFSEQHDYMPLRQTSLSTPSVGFSASPASISAPVAAPRASVNLVKVAKFDFTADPSGSVLGGTSGDHFSILDDDWREGGEWVWAASSNGQQGYVPRIAME
jgi:hypothetical protein